MNLGNDLGTMAPEPRVNEGSRANQKTRRVNKIDNLALSAKPPSPVQIRAAPPNFVRKIAQFADRGGSCRVAFWTQMVPRLIAATDEAADCGEV